VYEHVSLNIHHSANFFVTGYTSTDVVAVDGERSIRGNLDNDVSPIPLVALITTLGNRKDAEE